MDNQINLFGSIQSMKILKIARNLLLLVLISLASSCIILQVNPDGSVAPFLFNETKKAPKGFINKKPVLVYGTTQCGNCKYFRSKFKADGVKFEFRAINNNDKYNREMWDIVNKHYPGARSVTFPVILIDRKTAHVGPQYDAFMKKLKKSRIFIHRKKRRKS